MLGGVLSGVGMAASAFTQSIVQLYITAGVITGQQQVTAVCETHYKLSLYTEY